MQMDKECYVDLKFKDNSANEYSSGRVKCENSTAGTISAIDIYISSKVFTSTVDTTCDVTKASCSDSPYPNNVGTCWGDEAYQRCHTAGVPQEAYDAVMAAGGSTSEAYCLLQALIKS